MNFYLSLNLLMLQYKHWGETIDVAIVIDDSGSTTPAIMPSQLAFVQEFITGMTPGMSRRCKCSKNWSW